MTKNMYIQPSVSVTEMLQRFFTPVQTQDLAPDEKEVQDDNHS